MKGSNVNATATLGEVGAALRYASGKGAWQYGALGMTSFTPELKAKRPMVIRMGWNSGGGHAYVVSGADDGVNALYLIDPISGVSNQWVSHSLLKNGVSLPSGTGKHTNTWIVM